MRAEQILAVLMDDKKYKARVEELNAAEAKLSAVRSIADTLDAAKAIEEAAKQREQDLIDRQVKLEQVYNEKLKQLNDEVKACKVALDERGVKERARYGSAVEVRSQGIAAMEYANKLQDELDKQRKQLQDLENSLGKREADLNRRITKINEALNGSDIG